MMKIVCVLLVLLSLVEVHCQQTVPYVSFMDQTLADHSYVDISQVGTDGDSVQCHTDLMTCCNMNQGSHRGDWYFPDGDRLPFPGDGDIYESRQAQRVELRHNNNGNGPTGIYRCDIETAAVRDNHMRETVYIGLYTSDGGDITIMRDEVVYDSDQLTLTCISTGGPATTVTWTRDSTIVTEGTETVLDDPETAQYTHTLTVTTGGEYTCTVENNKPSSDSATITLTETSPPSGVTAVQDGPTSITVTWTASSDATGYRIHYTSDSDSGSETVSDGSTETHTMTGLVNGETYTISILASSLFSLPSESVTADMTVGLVPGQPTLSEMPTATATTISLSWSVPSGSVVTAYLVQWVRDTAVGCMDEDQGSTTITDGSAVSYEISGLQENSMYSMTVTASNAAGSAPVSNTVTEMTEEAVPSGPPSTITSGRTTPNSITLHWEEVDCLHHNGAITGYQVQAIRNEVVDGAALVDGVAREATISGLTPSTQYFVQVAAVNDIGTGPFIGTLLQTEATVVGLKAITFNVSESDKVVKICISAVGANTLCPSRDPFQLLLNTLNQSAESPSDYEALSEIIFFAPCDTHHCVNVSITNDLINEPEEQFSVVMTNATLFINLTLTTATVTITDDDEQPEAVTFVVLNATAVRLSWSGSAHLSTSIQYTLYSSSNGVIMDEYERVYPPGVTSTLWDLDDDIIITDTYVHNFTLHYIDVLFPAGPHTTASFTFDKVYFQIQFGPFHFCLDWNERKTAGVKKQLHSYITQVIRKQCVNCYALSPSFLRPGVFLCHKNPTRTTYRSTLINPFVNTTATQLVGIIQSWVSTGPSLGLDYMLVRVSPECPTGISNLDDEECVTGTSDPGLGERITQTLNVCSVRNLGQEVCRLGGC